MSINRTHLRPLVISTGTLAAGIAASLAGNLQAINLTDQAPGVGAYVSATFWPVALFLVIEVMLHTPWLRNWRDALTKALAVGLVGAMAAYISYFHLAHTLAAYGYDTASRYMGPLAIDAAMAMATLSLNRVGHARRALIAQEAAQSERERAEHEHAVIFDDWDSALDELSITRPISPAIPELPYPGDAQDPREVAQSTARVGRPAHADMLTLIEQVVSGVSARDIAVVSSATVRRYQRVWRLLSDDPNASLDLRALGVRQPYVDMLRERARIAATR